MKRILVVAVLAVCFAEGLQAQDSSPRPPQIMASGRGDIAIAADRAILVMSIENNSSSATSSASENARLVAATMNSLRVAGVKDSAMTNSGYSLNQEHENGDPKRPRKFFARNSIRIQVAHIADIGKYIDAALAGGATAVSPIQFLGANTSQARRDALKTAVEEARRDAETLASAGGGSLGRLLSMQSGISNQIAYRVGEAVATGVLAGRVAASPTSITPADIVVTATANGVWEFIPRQ